MRVVVLSGSPDKTRIARDERTDASWSPLYGDWARTKLGISCRFSGTRFEDCNFH